MGATTSDTASPQNAQQGNYAKADHFNEGGSLEFQAECACHSIAVAIMSLLSGTTMPRRVTVRQIRLREDGNRTPRPLVAECPVIASCRRYCTVF